MIGINVKYIKFLDYNTRENSIMFVCDNQCLDTAESNGMWKKRYVELK